MIIATKQIDLHDESFVYVLFMYQSTSLFKDKQTWKREA